MGTTFRSIDVIYKTVYGLGIRVIVLESNFHVYIVLGAFKIQHIFIKSFLASVQVGDKFLDTAFVMELHYTLFFIF